jgi:hypothetical protein
MYALTQTYGIYGIEDLYSIWGKLAVFQSSTV